MGGTGSDMQIWFETPDGTKGENTQAFLAACQMWAEGKKDG